MQHLKLFLTKFKDFVPPELVVKKLVQEVVEQKIGVKLTNSEIALGGGGVIYFKTRSAVKSEIFLHQEEIISELETKLAGLYRQPKKLI